MIDRFLRSVAFAEGSLIAKVDFDNEVFQQRPSLLQELKQDVMSSELVFPAPIGDTTTPLTAVPTGFSSERQTSPRAAANSNDSTFYIIAGVIGGIALMLFVVVIFLLRARKSDNVYNIEENEVTFDRPLEMMEIPEELPEYQATDTLSSLSEKQELSYIAEEKPLPFYQSDDGLSSVSVV